MARTFTFSAAHRYDTAQPGIELALVLECNGSTARVGAKLDTGSSFCIFERSVAATLGVEVESGLLQVISTANGRFNAYGHWVTIAALGYRVEAMAYFAADEWFSRNVLGRQGWIDRFRLCLVEHDGELFVSHYDEPQP